MTQEAGQPVREMSNRWFESRYLFNWLHTGFQGSWLGKADQRQGLELLITDGPRVSFFLLHQHFNYCSFTGTWENVHEQKKFRFLRLSPLKKNSDMGGMKVERLQSYCILKQQYLNKKHLNESRYMMFLASSRPTKQFTIGSLTMSPVD